MNQVASERLPRPERAAMMRADRRASILAAAIRLASELGYRAITREQVASVAGVAVGSINHEFRTMEGLRDAVMQQAVETQRLDIVAQGLAQRHPVACEAPPELREAASRALA